MARKDSALTNGRAQAVHEQHRTPMVGFLSALAGLVLLILPTPAFAHPGEPLAPHDLWAAWSSDPLVSVPMALSAFLYWRGVRRLRAAGGSDYARRTWRVRCFTLGWLSLFVALISPLDALGGVLFSGHMLQHEVLMIAAAPLLVAGRPGVPFLWALPAGWARRARPLLLAAPAQRSWKAVTRPTVAWALHGLAIWIWHIPFLFEATIVNDLVHTLQHASFFGTALLFWWALLEHDGRRGYGIACLYVFTTAVHSSILGALLTFAPTVWYPIYAPTTAAWGLTPLEDQQLGGLIMWVPAGVAYAISALVLFALWLQAPTPAAVRGTYSAEPQRTVH